MHKIKKKTHCYVIFAFRTGGFHRNFLGRSAPSPVLSLRGPHTVEGPFHSFTLLHIFPPSPT